MKHRIKQILKKILRPFIGKIRFHLRREMMAMLQEAQGRERDRLREMELGVGFLVERELKKRDSEVSRMREIELGVGFLVESEMKRKQNEKHPC